MDVIGVDDTMLEDLYDRDSALRLRRLVKECLTAAGIRGHPSAVRSWAAPSP